MNIPKAIKRGNKYRTQITVNGKRLSFTKDTEDEAVNAAMLAALTRKSDDDERQKVLSQVTLRSAIDNYIIRRKNVLSPSTIRGYNSIKRNRFKSIMDLPLTTQIDWQLLVNDEASEISAKTLQNCWGLLKSVLKDNKIDVDDVTLPQVVKKRRPFLQPKEIKIFVDAINGHKYELPYLLCLHGLRRSEMLALTKADIFDNYIHVSGSVVEGDEGFVEKDTNKNETSARNVPIMIPRIKELAKASPTDKLCPWHPGTIAKPLTTVCKHAGITIVSLHDLRRSFASLCYHLKVSEAQTMEWGGWSDISVMRKIYIEIAEEDRLKKADELKNFFK